MASGSATSSGTADADVTVRAARPEDCRRIAELFEMSSDGVADYVWSSLEPDHPGCSLLEIGARRYARENTAFSYQNCVVAERAGEVVGMLHAFVIEPAAAPAPAAEPTDPVLRPYAELEVPGSFYVSGLALLPGERGRGVGTRLFGVARERAKALGCAELSLICYAGNAGARRLYERHGFTVIDRRDIVPHPMIHATGEALLMAAPV
jgi:ribosomal protein S18 acetylase RimI-like enzyme